MRSLLCILVVFGLGPVGLVNCVHKEKASSVIGETKAQGQIVDVKWLPVKNTEARNVMVLLDTDTERNRRLVDLGPKEALISLNLTIGNSIAAEGPVAIIDGKEVLLANRFQIDGRTIDVIRTTFTNTQ